MLRVSPLLSRCRLGLAGLGMAAATACADPEPAKQPLVLLVSFDTTRVDAISAYGDPRARTPTVDGLAARGVRFDWALAQSPTTLSSHTSALSGLDPHGHRVVRNGFPVPDDIPLAQEVFAQAGWDTLAVVGSFALESKMKLSRGFRLYDDGGWLGAIGSFVFPADDVTNRALAAVDKRDPDKPLFLFVHYYDPHATWNDAPDDIRQHFINADYSGIAGVTIPHLTALTEATRRGVVRDEDVWQARGHYLAEVAFADRELGRLLEGLETRGLMDDSLVVLMSDHGEVFTDIPERPYRHGPDVDLVATHVPLVVAGKGAYQTPSGTVVSDLVRVQDLATTLLSAAGIDTVLGEARDLTTTWVPGAPPLPSVPSFAEANRPHLVTDIDGWPNRFLERGVALDGYLYTRAPYLEHAQLYRIDAQQTPVVDPEREAALAALLDAWDAAAPGHREVELSPDTCTALAALGYLDPSSCPPPTEAP